MAKRGKFTELVVTCVIWSFVGAALVGSIVLMLVNSAR